MYLVYILLCFDNTFYTGITNNLEKRLRVHSSKKGSKYVASRLPFKLAYQNVFPNKSLALKEEYRIKKLSRSEKEKLVKKHPHFHL